MKPSTIFLLISLIALVFIGFLIFIAGKRPRGSRLTPLAGLAFASILFGIFFGEDPLLGYGLIGIGVILAVIDMIQKRRKT